MLSVRCSDGRSYKPIFSVSTISHFSISVSIVVCCSHVCLLSLYFFHTLAFLSVYTIHYCYHGTDTFYAHYIYFLSFYVILGLDNMGFYYLIQIKIGLDWITQTTHCHKFWCGLLEDI